MIIYKTTAAVKPRQANDRRRPLWKVDISVCRQRYR